MAIDILLVLVGAIVLLGGGEMLVRGAVSLAKELGVSKMVVGLTVVAFATSAPEFVVSLTAAIRGSPAICAGNIVGSNILNILLVLGATALIYPLCATATFVRREVPIMVAITLLVWLLVRDAVLSRPEAAGLLVLQAAYVAYTVRIARREKAVLAAEFADTQPPGSRSLPLNVLLVVAGLALLTGGSRLFVGGAIDIAHHLNVSEAIIGLTLVAVGTSIPELAASLVAAWRKHPDICLGNIIGSCVFNLLWIGGTCGVVQPVPFNETQDHMLSLHIPVMVGSAVILWPIIATRHRLSRAEGVLLLVLYVGYLALTVHLGM